jgi:hypothetical protein
MVLINDLWILAQGLVWAVALAWASFVGAWIGVVLPSLYFGKALAWLRKRHQTRQQQPSDATAATTPVLTPNEAEEGWLR